MNEARADQLKVHVFDVGHGDSTLLEFPGGDSFGIVDCCHKPGQEPPVLTLLRERASKRSTPIVVHFVALTHPHKDHFNGFAEVLRTLRELRAEVREVWYPPCDRRWVEALFALAAGPADTEAAKELDSFVAEVDRLTSGFTQGFSYVHASGPVNRPWIGPNGVSVTTLAPNVGIANRFVLDAASDSTGLADHARERVKSAGNVNGLSSAFLVTFGKARILLAGDLTNESWELMLDHQSAQDPRCHVIKVPHHGSTEGNCPAQGGLYSALRLGKGKSIAVISGGYRRRLPDPAVVEEIQDSGWDVYCTGSPTKEVLRRSPLPIQDPIVRALVDLQLSFYCRSIERVYQPSSGSVVITCARRGSISVATETSVQKPTGRRGRA